MDGGGMEIDAEVPPELYVVVAEVLAYVYQLQGKKLPMPPRGAA